MGIDYCNGHYMGIMQVDISAIQNAHFWTTDAPIWNTNNYIYAIIHFCNTNGHVCKSSSQVLLLLDVKDSGSGWDASFLQYKLSDLQTNANICNTYSISAIHTVYLQYIQYISLGTWKMSKSPGSHKKTSSNVKLYVRLCQKKSYCIKKCQAMSKKIKMSRFPAFHLPCLLFSGLGWANMHSTSRG